MKAEWSNKDSLEMPTTTMSDYIKREDAERAIQEDFRHACRPYEWMGLEDALDDLSRVPSADVVEAKHGQWKILRPQSLRLDRRDSLFECSECGASRIRRTGEILNYCPNCGARMDGEEQENE